MLKCDVAGASLSDAHPGEVLADHGVGEQDPVWEGCLVGVVRLISVQYLF